jgi:hypothetical protein
MIADSAAMDKKDLATQGHAEAGSSGKLTESQ